MNDRGSAGCVQLYAALCWSLLLTRARRRGPVWCAAVLLWLMAGQELPRHGAPGAAPASGAGFNEVSVARGAELRDEGEIGWGATHALAMRPEHARPRVRSLLSRELPPVRAPDCERC